MVQRAHTAARRAGVALVALALAAGCGSGDDSTTSASSPPREVTTSTAPAAAPSTTGTTAPTGTTRPPTVTTATTTPAPSSTTVSEADAGRSLTLRRGDLLTVVLHSTYWSFTSPPSTVVAPDGPASVAPDLQGCVPGGGCGTVTIRYRALAAGSAIVSAHRDSCGEARGCGPGQGDWQVVVGVAA